jgi:hypothetical protein
MLCVRFRQEGALVMVKPPRKPIGTRILEINNHVFVSIEKPCIKQLASAVHHPAIPKLRVGVDTLAVEARENRRRADSVKTPIMKANQNHHRL